MISEAYGNQSGVGDVQSHLQGRDTTPGNSRNNLLPAFGLYKKSHLPTPQSPSNVAAYASELNGSYTSPVPNVNRDAQMTYVSVPKASTPPRDDAQAVPSSSFMTPESSPVLPRRLMPLATPVAGPSSTPRTPLRNIRERVDSSGSVADHAVAKMAVDTAILEPPPIITTPISTHSCDLTPASRLSSPFQDRLSAADRHTAKSQSKSPILVDSLMQDVFAAPPPSTPPPLMTPVPQRAIGGEIQRIHLQLAADRAERMAETEARRPQYFVREKRPHPDADIPTLDELDAASATLGVTESPVKGRRLQLFQATSEETFEQSLLAGGYPGYGQSPAYKNGEPQTPSSNGKGRGALSQRAMQWLQHATPGQPGSSATTAAAESPTPDEPDWVPSENEVRKRRRLDAFREDSEKKGTGSKLYPVEVEGRGRLLLDVPPEGTAAQPEAPVKKRINRRKKRRGGRRGHANETQDEEVLQPNWPDTAFPWCLRVQERTHAEKLEQEERLAWIARFLDRDSESESGEEDQELRPPLQSHENDQVTHRRGRGKMVPLRTNPDAILHSHRRGRGQAGKDESVLLPSDPADARAALLSKRSVRTLGSRRREAQENEVEEVKCVGCDRGDDGSELVQCDECQIWYHLPCIGIKNVAELGREEDPWYCDKCLDIIPSSPLTEPMFVPTDDRPIDPPSRRDSLFLQNPLLVSPAPNWDGESVAAPQTPVRGSSGRADGLTRTFSTRSSWGDSSSRAGPSTPESSARTVRVYDTPGPFALAFDRDGFDPETPFDPTTTPSRGIKFSGGPPPTLGMSTPKGGLGLWAGRGGQTPTPAKFGAALAGLGVAGSSAGGRHNWGEGVSGSGVGYPRSIYSAAYDDTPITRAPRTKERLAALSAGGRRLWDAPGTHAEANGEAGEGEMLMETEA